jgi:hypothetical protein
MLGTGKESFIGVGVGIEKSWGQGKRVCGFVGMWVWEEREKC